MSDYFHKYLRQTFGLELIAVEWAYSLHDTLPRHTSDPRIALFWRVLNDEVTNDEVTTTLLLLVLHTTTTTTTTTVCKTHGHVH